MPVEHDPHSGQFTGGGSSEGAKSSGEKEYHTIYHAANHGGAKSWSQIATTGGGIEKAKAMAKSLQNKIANRNGAPTMRVVKGRAAMSNRKESTAEDPATQHVHEQKGWGENEHGFGDSADMPAETFDDMHADEAPRQRTVRVTRHDRGELAKPVRDAEGFLTVEGVLARCCILEYQTPTGTRHELVTPEVLFDAESMRSLAAKALTNEHPTALLTPETVGAHQIGSIGEPRRDGDRLVSVLGVLRADAIAAVESGKAELSCGYSCEIDETPGEHPTLTCPQCGTSKYDGVQRDRRGNHVAIVGKARAGDSARIRLDSDGNALIVATQQSPVYAATQQSQLEPETMPNMIHLDGIPPIDGAAPDAQAVLARSIATIRADAAALTASEKARADKASADLASTAKRLDGIKANVAKRWAGLKAKFDAMMKRNVMCDECMGAKEMDGAKCPSCDGVGMVSARDMIKGMEPAKADEDPNMAMEGMEDDLSGEPPAEEATEKAANPAHEDPKRSDARAKRKDSIARMIDRRAASRAALLTSASKHVDSLDLVGKNDVEIKRLVVAKIDATAGDVTKMDAATVGVLYDAAIKRTATDGAAPSFALTNATFPAARADAKSIDALAKFAANTEAASNPWARPTSKQ